MALETFIVDMLLDRLVETIKARMMTAIPKGDLARAEVVKKGLLLEAKVENVVSIGVTGGDHEDPNYRDGIITMETMQNIGFEVPPREIGGGQYWWRRGVARIECFYISKRLTEDNAHVAAYAALGRLLQSIEETSTSGLVDSFGEAAIKIFCHSNTLFESGGPPNQYIFRGKVFWSALTERPY